jgi:hypothetical protein
MRKHWATLKIRHKTNAMRVVVILETFFTLAVPEPNEEELLAIV